MTTQYLTLGNDLIIAGLFSLAIFVILIISEWLNRQRLLVPQATRKLVHILVGIMASFSPAYFESSTMVVVLGLLFTAGNYSLLKRDLAPSINGDNRQNYGTVFFPLAYLMLALFWWRTPIVFTISMLIMTIADPLAGTLGSHVTTPWVFRLWREAKSVQGSVTMFILTFLLVTAGLMIGSWRLHLLPYYPANFILGASGLTALIATIAEAASRNGSDNLSVPVLSAGILDILLIQYHFDNFFPIALWILLTGAVFILIGKLNWLTPDGCAGAWVLGILVFATHGWSWLIPLLFFLVSGSMLTHSRKKMKPAINQHLSPRRIEQVFANGGIALLIAWMSFYFYFEVAYIVFLAAIAAATADTWGTEIGLRSHRIPRHILTFSYLNPGDSGGVTVLGTFGSTFGAACIAGISLLFGCSIATALIILFAGFAGSVFDSLLGGTIQAKYSCSQCGTIIETKEHCGYTAQRKSGLIFINNDVVNWLNTGIGALIALWLLR